MAKPIVSMIVSNLNGMSLNLLPDCIDSLLNPGIKDWELVVVDNNSDDHSVAYLKERFKKLPNCHVVQNPINMYSQGLNLGAKKATGRYLAYFNNDVALEKGYFQELIKQLDKDPNVAIGQGKLVNLFNHTLIDSAGETMDKYGNPITIGHKEKDRGQYDKEEEILSASGSACMIKKELFNKIGGYDNDYGIGYEDMDLALRSRRLGYVVKRFPKAIVYHKRASTDLAAFVRIKVKWHFNKNRLSTMIKNYPLGILIMTLPVTLVLYTGIIAYEWIVRKNWKIGWVRLTSILWNVVNLPQTLSKRQAITSKGAQSLGNHEFSLFSPRSIYSLFKDFASAK